MTETTWTSLRQLLTDRYDELRARLTRRLGSEDLARETLHETWLHLHRRDGIETVENPKGYLLRTAFNIATDRGRKASRLARRVEIQEVLDLPDETPSPAELTEARQEIAALERALEDLTPRRRTILLSSRLEGTPLRLIAEQLGISQRMVEIELKHALDHCAERLDRKVARRFGPGPRETS
jgi:RNA polymerase sigma-70 factor (ECF subfamily)